jgi:hypothetical protein
MDTRSRFKDAKIARLSQSCVVACALGHIDPV